MNDALETLLAFAPLQFKKYLFTLLLRRNRRMKKTGRPIVTFD